MEETSIKDCPFKKITEMKKFTTTKNFGNPVQHETISESFGGCAGIECMAFYGGECLLIRKLEGQNGTAHI